MITPFTADGRVDYEALGRMIDYVIEGGADYIVALGTTAGRQKGWERENPATDSGNPSEKTMDGFVEVTEQMELPF